MSGPTISRRPYTDCPFTWSMSIADVSGGEGTVSEAACDDINGDFVLEFKACDSRGGRLVWASTCIAPGSRCGGGGGESDCCDTCYTLEIPAWDIDNGDGVIHSIPEQEVELPYFRSFFTPTPNGAAQTCEWSSGIPAEPCGIQAILYQANGGAWGDLVVFFTPCFPGYPIHYDLAIGVTGQACETQTYTLRPDQVPNASYPPTINVVAGTECQSSSRLPDSSSGSTTDEPCGPEANDRNRSKWTLFWDIADTKWILESFNRLEYPRYSLIDATPCEGETKVLTLDDHPSGAENGCNVAPATVTLTRECGPEREPREHQRSKQTGQLRRPCGCACDDEISDSRHLCHSKCASVASPGCESYSADGITCKYPKSSDCCEYCETDSAPCAYEVLFDCQLDHEGTNIAAKRVVLRHECYFNSECEWVALGPETASCGTAESPIVGEGTFGAQPVCASCTDDCQTGCSWATWVTAPGGVNIITALGISWRLNVAEVSTLSFQHPTFGLIEYQNSADAPWLCGNLNTMNLVTKPDSLPDGVLPLKVCVRPKFDGECAEGCYDLNTVYIPASAKCACKDPECDFTLPLFLTCNGVTESCIGQFTAGSAATECDAAGPVYSATCVLNSVSMEVRIYCDGTGSWYADIYNDGVLCTGCVAMSPTFCPFTMAGGGAVPICSTCVPCIGDDCETPCDATDCANFPDTMTATFSGSACFSGSATLTRDLGVPTQWNGDSLVGGRWSIVMDCNGDGTFTMSAIDGDTQCAAMGWASTSAECNPASISFASATVSELGGCTCIGDTVTLSVSA